MPSGLTLSLIQAQNFGSIYVLKKRFLSRFACRLAVFYVVIKVRFK
ncbi:hypothetical protein ALP32_200415 [Pseudomonas avellanae]|uniref:Uncharacterized protein n=1 Tax=Pseudomonas avellanae TaxID=46257 RepID=A0A3M5T4V7_9PSED|nr:hypothetical protein ALP32_200415 [Pseudomonas avellanae]